MDNYSFRDYKQDLRDIKPNHTLEEWQSYQRLKNIVRSWEATSFGNPNIMQHEEKIYFLYDQLKKLPKLKHIEYEVIGNLLSMTSDKIDIYIREVISKAETDITLSLKNLIYIYEDSFSADAQRLNHVWKQGTKELKYDATYHFFVLNELIIEYAKTALIILDNAITKNSSNIVEKETMRDKENEENNETLSVVQKLLLFRFLQKYGKFPKKTPFQTDKQELEMIGAATGVKYEDLKKAKQKVEQIMDLRITKNQVHAKVDDLQKVLNALSKMELQEIVNDVKDHIDKLIEIR